jgi:cytochrome P450
MSSTTGSEAATAATAFEATDYFTDESIPANPHPYFDFLLERPVWREPHHGVVMVAGYEEALEVYHRPEVFSSCNFVAGPDTAFPVPFEGDDIREVVATYRHTLPQTDQLPSFDPPIHTDHRALIMRLITPKRLSENETFMWRLADRKLDEILSLDECEFIGDYAQPYATLVVADLLGVPERDHAMLLDKMGIRTLPGTVNERLPSDHHSMEGLYDYFADKVEERRRNPSDDVLTGMARATLGDGTTPEPLEVARIASNLFAAGRETTVRLLGAALRMIGDQPELQERLRARRDLIPNFVEETLRLEGPVKGDFRLAVVSTKLGDVDIRAGTTVMVLNGVTGRDRRRFDSPEEFRADRPDARHHLAFGHGIHFCPGAPLARSEARITIERLFDRTRVIEISEAAHGPADSRRYEYLPSFMFRGLSRLGLRLTPDY